MTRRIAALLWLIALAGTAQAHLLPKQTATMNIVDRAAFLVVSIPASALTGVDDDGNRLLSPTELQTHTAQIQQQFAARFRVTDAGNPATPVLSWIVPSQADGDVTGSDYVIVLSRVNFTRPPVHPILSTDLFGTREGEARMTLTATRSKTSEVAILEASSPSHTFFRGSPAIFVDFVRIGMEHILGGLDHLLFLLTLVIAAAGWRYWLGVVTSFTLAHSITLSLSALDMLRLPGQIIEPGIALSIVIMALLNLRRQTGRATGASRARLAVVFACGLLHGFGFASAIGAMAVDTGSRVATLAGFNLGIELGQCLFVGTVISLAMFGQKVWRGRLIESVPNAASVTAAFCGALLLVQRVWMS
jgi:hypothetical protein